MAQTNIAQTINGVTIRQANASDIPTLESFIKQFVESGDLLPRTLDELEDLLGNFFIATDEEGEMVGCAALEVYSKKLAEIRSLAVSPKAQGRGVGKRLVKICLDLAHEQSIFEVMAISAQDDFFKACGFDYTLPRLRRAFFIQTRDEI
ncbi:GNAT family N-acetyltransferase [Phototrophicus methaneseepsis]|uniref:GNAT family N-acetyltransferase n=1 Tax=Phototrophicus methaneseepsis TaxID=2710758 RepID=A0A7S8IFD1_9CHLR|nr:GNAT family N-acetyltransferase [Phototrophicus methaneseepsis]QPC83476.1 GNAT family N-acetyltransferase [Phototrophicus methaneseepsis]